MRTFKKYFTCIPVVVIIIISGCKKDDWYDIKSDKQLAVPTTLKDMQALMDYAWVMNKNTPGMGEVASDGHYVSEARALVLTDNNRNAYTWSKEQQYREVYDWNYSGGAGAFGSYTRIYYTNLVLDGLEKITPANSDEKIQWDNIKGQALFHRAHAFYELAQVFADAYESNSASTKLGIPLRLESDVNIPSKRGTVQQTYRQIINDLELANKLLPISASYKTRPSQQAVFALLARVYLSMEDYANSSIYANLCLSSYNTLMDYKTLSATGTTNPITDYNPEIIFYASIHTALNVISFTNILIDRNLYDSYDANDLRKKIFFNENITTKLVTYKGTYSGRGFNQCFSGLATDEVYLIRAECYARDGKTAEAMSDLNTLLNTRWSGTYVNKTALNAEDALKQILLERRKELILRGLRWSDLRRLNRDPRFAITLTRKIGTTTYTLEPNSYKYTFPIPDDIIEMTKMPQNEGW